MRDATSRLRDAIGAVSVIHVDRSAWSAFGPTRLRSCERSWTPSSANSRVCARSSPGMPVAQESRMRSTTADPLLRPWETGLPQPNDAAEARDLGIETPWQRDVKPASPSPGGSRSSRRVRAPEERR
jgi:hypothetical protein